MNFVALQSFDAQSNKKIHTISGLILLFSHVVLFAIFYYFDMEFFVEINAIAIVAYMVVISFAIFGKDSVSAGISHVAVIAYSCINVLAFGWGYGFEYYIFGLFSLLYFDARSINRFTFLISAVEFLVFLSLYCYTQMGYELVFSGNVPSSVSKYQNIILISNLFAVCIFLTIFQHLFNLDTAVRIIELNSQRQLYEKLANYDSLTGILNRQSFSEIIKTRYDKDYPLKSSVLIVDIDYFKHINDRYGHDRGDSVLMQVANILKNIGGRNDLNLVSRWGGEEFVMDIYDALSIERLQEYAQNILDTIAKHDFEGLGERVSVSIGGCWSKEINMSYNEYQDMIHIADKNLYKCKSMKRGLAEVSQYVRKK